MYTLCRLLATGIPSAEEFMPAPVKLDTFSALKRIQYNVLALLSRACVLSSVCVYMMVLKPFQGN